MHTITRKLEFDAGHRVYQHESKCNHIHGHRYVVELECAGDLDDLGRVVDFSVIKRLVGSWIDHNLDHGMIIYEDDPLLGQWESWAKEDPENDDGITPQKYFVMSENPTAENLSELLYYKSQELLNANQSGIKVLSVTLWETPNCKATYRP